MTILSAQSILLRLKDTPEYRRFEQWRLEIKPFVADVAQYKGKSYGLTAAGYDIRLGKIRHPRGDNSIVESCWLSPGQFTLAASLEFVRIPTDLQVIVHDKSSWARDGLALQNTVLEPGWFGYITLELSNHGRKGIQLMTGMPIAQLVFHQLDRPTDRPYTGKYQNQSAEPTPSINMPEDISGEQDDS